MTSTADMLIETPMIHGSCSEDAVHEIEYKAATKEWRKQVDRFVYFNYEWTPGRQIRYFGKVTNVSTSIDKDMKKSVAISIATHKVSGCFRVWPKGLISDIRFDEHIYSSRAYPLDWDDGANKSLWDTFPPGYFF